MAKFCTYCGAPLEQNAVSCKECGVKVLGAQATTETIVETTTPVAPKPDGNNSPAQTVVKAQTQTEPTGRYGVTKTSAFFWLTLLFSLPIVGFICSIVFNFTAKKLSTRHFSRAIMLWYIVGIVASILSVILLFVLGAVLGFGIMDLIDEIMYY